MILKKLVSVVFFLSCVYGHAQQADKLLKEGVEFYEAGEFIKADSAISLAIKYDVNYGKDYRKYYYRGIVRMELDSIPSAITDLTQAIRIKPDLYEAVESRAICYYYWGNIDAAFDDINTALKIQPKNIEGLVLRAILNFDKKDYNAIIVDCSRGIAAKKDPRFYAFRSIGYSATGKLDKSLKDLESGRYYFGNSDLNLLEAEMVLSFYRGNDICDLQNQVSSSSRGRWSLVLKEDDFSTAVSECE